MTMECKSESWSGMHGEMEYKCMWVMEIECSDDFADGMQEWGMDTECAGD